MKKLLLTLAILSLASVAFAQNNEIGIYTTPDGNPDNTSYNGVPGQITAYVVVTSPVNYNFGAPDSGVQTDIGVIGGFEFRVVLPSNVFLLAGVLPPQSTNFATPPDYLVGSNAPVVDGAAVLVTLNLGEFSGTPSLVYLRPVQDAPQSIAGSMAITDYNDDFRLNPAYPVSGDYNVPVFGLWTAVVPTEDASWGELKNLYR